MEVLSRLAQGEVVRTEPSRRAETILGVFVMVVAIAGLVALQRRENLAEQPNASALTWFAIVVLFLGYSSALVNGRRWLLARDIVRMSDSEVGRAVEPPGFVAQPRTASAIPVLSIDQFSSRRRDRPRDLRQIAGTRNIMGQPPLRIAYLRIFDNQPRARTFMQGAWREFGYVYMLRSATSVTPKEYRVLRHDGVDLMFVTSRSALERALDGAEAPPHRRGRTVFRDLAPTTVRTHDKYGGYPPVAFLCHGSVWREAVDELLLRVDAVCLDLSGFTEKHRGTGYELQRVVDRFPIERVVFLMDPKSSEKFLKGAILTAWDRMAAGSPNEGNHLRRTHLVRTDQLRTTITTNDRGQELSRQSRLVAQRTKTRTLAASLQGWLASAPPLPRTPSGRLEDPVGSSPPRASRWPARSPVRWVAAIALTGLALAGVATAAPGLVSSSSTSIESQIPDLVGLPLGEAKNHLREAKLKWKVTEVENPKPKNTVIGQSPESGSSVDQGFRVKLMVSRGPTPPKLVPVPDLKNANLEDAVQLLNQKGLELGDSTLEHSGKDAGTVLRSKPIANEKVPRGAPIDLVVASGQNLVPNVVGRSRAAAETNLHGEGFESTVLDTLETSDAQPGTVVRQFPPQGTVRELGSTVELTLSATASPSPPPVTSTASPDVSPTPSQPPVPSQTGQ